MRLTKAAVGLTLLLALCACGPQQSEDGTDGAAVAACRAVLEDVAGGGPLATTVRDEGEGFVISAWRDGKPDGDPDYLCDVARDDSAERGVAVVKVQTRDSDGAGYRSTLDLKFDQGS